jgi:hypothetical protein
MVDNLMEIGKPITCMEKEFILGKMEGDMKENIIMTRNMDLVFILGPMGENMKVIGETVNNMEKVVIYYLLVNLELDIGKRVRD